MHDDLIRVAVRQLESRDEIERLTSGSGRGRRKSTRKGNSLAAYSTASTVRGGEVGKGLFNREQYLAGFLLYGKPATRRRETGESGERKDLGKRVMRKAESDLTPTAAGRLRH